MPVTERCVDPEKSDTQRLRHIHTLAECQNVRIHFHNEFLGGEYAGPTGSRNQMINEFEKMIDR